MIHPVQQIYSFAIPCFFHQIPVHLWISRRPGKYYRIPRMQNSFTDPLLGNSPAIFWTTNSSPILAREMCPNIESSWGGNSWTPWSSLNIHSSWFQWLPSHPGGRARLVVGAEVAGYVLVVGGEAGQQLVVPHCTLAQLQKKINSIKSVFKRNIFELKLNVSEYL